MQKTSVMLALFCCLALSGCVTTAATRVDTEDPVTKLKITTFRAGDRPLGVTDAERIEPLFVKEMNSPLLTDQIVDLLKHYKFNAVSAYTAPQPLPADRNELSLTGSFESRGHIQTKLAMDSLHERKDEKIETDTTVGNLLSVAMYLLTRNAMPLKGPAALNTLNDVGVAGAVTGVSGAINERLYGDYRGRCTTDCDKQLVSDQKAMIGASYIRFSGGKASAFHSTVITTLSTDHLVPYELVDRALLEALRPLTEPEAFAVAYQNIADKQK